MQAARERKRTQSAHYPPASPPGGVGTHRRAQPQEGLGVISAALKATVTQPGSSLVSNCGCVSAGARKRMELGQSSFHWIGIIELQTMVIVGRITLPLGAWAEGGRCRWYDWQSEFSSIARGPSDNRHLAYHRASASLRRRWSIGGVVVAAM